ncbi:GNAT family N-acetyltransferase [Rhodanobacter sp. L36]|uniref:GNAT family N-acetyltransferase n=1 Tax=Rhodanobacter sp. L36 TaxID=1747221 RepID=UPI00131E201F|nr:GNAT family N-acetyltransferase [Rhodanobacter sp. L36]
MKLENFHIEVAEWSRERDRDALRRIRQQVFVVEQNVPESRERDGLDADCCHVLALDDAGQPIGCGRLTPEHKIGRMAVLREWRGHGVGVALLRELVERARALGWPELGLAAQVSAIAFYERAGFSAYGDEFEDAGLQHRAMRLSLTAGDAGGRPTRDIAALPVTTRAEAAAARLKVLAGARHQLSIYLPMLDRDTYSSTDELDEVKRIAISGRAAQIRILLHDPAAALRHDHRLIALTQRLSSAVQVRVPVEEVDLAHTSTYLLNDAGGYLFLPEADRPQGRAALNDRASQVPLLQHFDDVWERAEIATVLQALNL